MTTFRTEHADTDAPLAPSSGWQLLCLGCGVSFWTPELVDYCGACTASQRDADRTECENAAKRLNEGND